MAYTSNFDASNKADFIVEISATDAETGDVIDFTGAEIAIAIEDERRCRVLNATLNDGITMPTSTVIRLQFTEDQMSRLCAGSYQIGGVYKINDVTTQLFVGEMSVYDGIARL